MFQRRLEFLAILFCLCLATGAAFAALPELIQQVKPSIVAVGTLAKMRSPPFVLRGAGFVVGNGSLIATNAHVVPEATDEQDGEVVAIHVPVSNRGTQLRQARMVAIDKQHDIALLRIEGPPLPALRLQEKAVVREGQAVVFIGFPIGTVLGASPVTHRGIISAITPIVMPSANARQLNERVVSRLKTGSFDVYQLDGTAYPGNSGGPLLDQENGEVVGIINMVFVKGTKEAALSQPSGISFAIPVIYLQEMLRSIK
ncbi:S1C family serine protease [Propionivibrio limicola]|uniref:S1C family serine protease n=1 Tax=Propionivibrio limicola TaxID=167645 RepID=UPI001292192F|nr:serine protease [Propionivibrio limicola]